MSASLSLRALTRRFPGARAATLDGLDLDVAAGGCVALLGPSGSGKSTALRLVAGLDMPDGGDVLVGGRPVTHLAPERRRVALTFQRPRLFPHLDVRDNVAFPMTVAGARRRDARRDAERFLHLVGMRDLGRRRTSTLSGGQEQRVALARALAARPDVLLLDEPFSALDPTSRAEMHRLLTELRAAVEPTVLLVTHDRDEAATVADTVAVLLDGRVAQHDTVGRLHTAPGSLAVHFFLDGKNAVRGVVRNGTHYSRLGALLVPGVVPDGDAVLVMRQESLQLSGVQDPLADACGRVRAVHPLGARVRVDVDVRGEVVVVETPVLTVRVGDAVGVVVPPGARHVIPSGSPLPAANGVPTGTHPGEPPH
jgi:putative spermidine/putrescine transport system ATP-binding protein